MYVQEKKNSANSIRLQSACIVIAVQTRPMVYCGYASPTLGPLFLELSLGFIDLGSKEVNYIPWTFSAKDGRTSYNDIRSRFGTLVNRLGAYTPIDLNVQFGESPSQLGNLGHALPNELLASGTRPDRHDEDHV